MGDPSTKRAYETQDVPVRRVTGAILVVLLALPVAMAAVTGLLLLDHREPVDEQVEFSRDIPVPKPALQADPERDWVEYRKAAEARLHNWGWASPDRERIRMPIEEAMQQISRAQRPAADSAASTKQEGEE